METSCEAQGWKRQDKLVSKCGRRVTTLPVQPCSPWGSNNKQLTRMPAKQRWDHVRGIYRENSYLCFIMDVSLVLKNNWWIMKDIYQTLEKFQHWKNLPSFIKGLKLQCIFHYVIWKHMCMSGWVSGLTSKPHCPASNWIQPNTGQALRVPEHLKIRNKIIPNDT